MDAGIMAGIKCGPNQAYADEYARANDHIDAAAAALVWIGSRVYAGALLRTGGKVKLIEAWKAAVE